jgi:hypothetical protein
MNKLLQGTAPVSLAPVINIVLQAEKTVDCDGCVVDHWHYLVEDSPECLGQLQARIGDQPAALVGMPESDKPSTVFTVFSYVLCRVRLISS